MKAPSRNLFAIILASVLFLSACGQQAPSTPSASTSSDAPTAAAPAASSGGATAAAPATSSGEPVELRITWWGTQGRHERTLKVIDMFQQKYPNIKISAEYMGQDTYGDKLTTQIAGGNAPDIMQLGNNYVDYARRGALLDLTPYVGKEIDLSDFQDSFIEPGKLDNKLYGVDLATNGIGYIINLDLVKKAGMQPPPNDWTWDGLEAYGKELVAKLGPDYAAFADQSKYSTLFQYYLRQSGKAIYQDGKVAFAKEDAVKWLTMWQRFRDAKLVPSAEVTAAHVEISIDTSVLPEGKTVMTQNWVNQLPAFENAMKAEVNLFTLPSGGPGTQNGYWLHPGQFWSVSATSKHPVEAAMFINYTINDPEATKVLGVDRGFPGSAKVRAVVEASAQPVEQKMLV